MWIDTSLVFEVKSGVQSYQTISTALVLAIVTGHSEIFVIGGRTCILVYVDDLIMAGLTYDGCEKQIEAVRSTLNLFNIPHDGRERRSHSGISSTWELNTILNFKHAEFHKRRSWL